MISEHGTRLPMNSWALKSVCLTGGTCVSYSGSPELALSDFWRFCEKNPGGASYATTVEFFEQSSASTNNDYIIAFAKPAKLVTIRNGHRTSGLSKTHWIGDKAAYEQFRKLERRPGPNEKGRAVTAAIFADEMTGSPASDLYSAMRNVVSSRAVPSVGGFITVLSNRDAGFRFSAYSDVMLDWPTELHGNQELRLTDKFDLRASGANDRYSVSQISPGYYDMNAVAFYVLKGRLLVVFIAIRGSATACITLKDVEPDRIATTLDEKLGFSFKAMCLVMSARQGFSLPVERSRRDDGISLGLYCEFNTMPKVTPTPEHA